jgi:hypothetical protein
MARQRTGGCRFLLTALMWGAVLAGALYAAPARADQLIQIPTANRVEVPTFEYLQRVDGSDEGYATGFVPLGQSFEIMGRYYNNLDKEHRIEAGGMFQLLPDGYVTPGVAVGIWDITNHSPWGRRFFFVLTKSLRQGQWGLVPKPIQRVEFTVGTGSGRFTGLLAGAKVVLPFKLGLIAEYDARRLNVGATWNPVTPLTLKAQLQNGTPYLGGELAFKF